LLHFFAAVEKTATVRPADSEADRIIISSNGNTIVPLLICPQIRSCPRTIWHYTCTNFALAQERITETDWDALLSDDIKSSWQLWSVYRPWKNVY